MRNFKKLTAFLLVAPLLTSIMISDANAVLKVKSNAAGKRYIAKPNDEPLMWHTDTGWGMCRCVSKKSDGSYDIEKAKTYIAKRKEQGFNVVMGVIRHCLYGKPLDQADLFPYPGDNNALNGFVKIMEYAKSVDMYVGVLPVWGADITDRNEEGAYNMTEAEAFAWGKKVGEKLRPYNDNIIWIIGGDSRPFGNGIPGNKDYRPLFREMAEGIALGVTNTSAEIKYNNNDTRWDKVFMTYHPHRGWSSSDDFASDYWIDFHGFETSPQDKIPKERRAYGMTKRHWDNFRSKPVISLEDVYFNNDAWYNNVDLHHSGYQTMLAGAAGYSFGWWDIWNFDKAKWLNTLYNDDNIEFTKTFKQVLNRIQWHLLEPDQGVIAADAGELYSQHQKIASKMVVKRIVVYYPQRNEATINVSALNVASGGKVKVTWINTLATYAESNISTPTVSSDKKLKLTPPTGFANAILIVEPTSQQMALCLEAECAAVGSNWMQVSDATASAGAYMTTQKGFKSRTSAPTGVADRISFSFQVPVAGSYHLFARVKAPTTAHNSFWVRVDGGSWILWSINTLASSFDWRAVQNSPFTFSTSGTHTLDIAYREAGTHLDKVNISSSGIIPIGTGQAASNCGSTARLAAKTVKGSLSSEDLSALGGEASQAMADDIVVYPNPSKGLFEVYLNPLRWKGKGRMTVRNLQGTLIREIRFEQAFPQSMVVDLRDQAVGVYIIHLQSKNRAIVKKLIKSN